MDKTKIGLRKGDVLIYPGFLKHFDLYLFGPNSWISMIDSSKKTIRQKRLQLCSLIVASICVQDDSGQ